MKIENALELRCFCSFNWTNSDGHFRACSCVWSLYYLLVPLDVTGCTL